MRLFLLVFPFLSVALGQSVPRVQISHTTENLRGASAVSRQIAWASGTHGTYLRTVDGGKTWTPVQVAGAEALDFRGVAAFSADDAFLMSSGPGELSRIYHTGDGGKHWDLQYKEKNPKGFLDSIAFWDAKHGVAVGDPVPDESGKLKFEVLLTNDGQNWKALPASRLPDAVDGEGAFAASNTCLAILASPADRNVWFATGGKVARVFHSSDRGETWQVFDTPVWHGKDSTGIFSIAFRDASHGVIAGGDYKHPNDDGPNLAFAEDGGKTWNLSALHPLAYFSAVVYDRQASQTSAQQEKARIQPVAPERLLMVGQDFLFDFRPPRNPRRISPRKSWGMKFNAASAYPEGGVLVVGPKGAMVAVP